MGLKIRVEDVRVDGLKAMQAALGGGAIQEGARLGLNEHVDEQRRQSVVRISAFTGVPQGYVGSKTRTLKATGGTTMVAGVETKDKALNIAQFGKATWSRSMPGAEVSGWNVRKIYPGAFVAKGKVLKRKTDKRFPLKAIWGPVLANELLRRDWKSAVPNPVMAERFMEQDLAARVLRITAVKLGF